MPHLFHTWIRNEEKSTGETSYYECSKCGLRKFSLAPGKQKTTDWRPVDWNWLIRSRVEPTRKR